MADFATKQADPGTPAAQDAPNTQQAQVEKVLMSFGESEVSGIRPLPFR